MKDKCKILCFFFISSLLLAGCNHRQNLSVTEFPELNTQKQEETVISGSTEREQKEHNGGEVDSKSVQSNDGNSVQSENGNIVQINTKKVNQIIEELNAKEKFMEIMQAGEETLLLHCRNRETGECTFYALGIKEGEESVRPIVLDLVGEVDCYSYEESVVLYDTMNHVIVLDDHLEILNEITIPDSINSIGRIGERKYCVFPRDQKLLYYKTVLEDKELYVGVFETDYACQEGQLVYKLEGPETNLNFLNGLYKISPSYSQNGMFFTGGYFETIDTQSKDCVGYLNLDTKELVVCKTNRNCMEVSGAGAVYYDGYRVTDSEYTGELLAIDEAGNVSRITTEFFKESERVSCNRYGDILTSYENENGETILNLYKENIWAKQIVIPYNLVDFILLDRGQYILCSYRGQDGLKIFLQEIGT